MQTLVEHGVIIEYENEDEFEQAKIRIDNLAKLVKENIFTQTAMHEISLSADSSLTCFADKGRIRFAIYCKDIGLFKRNITARDVAFISANKMNLLTWRLMAAAEKQPDLPPLNRAWERSLQKELAFRDSNKIIELKNPTALNVSIEELREQEEIEK